MTDAELTSFAAKAFGNAPPAFAPLTDDGDALRLAVKLHLWIGQHPSDGVTVSPHSGRTKLVEEDHDNDPYAATRRAIVRAAAEIGRAMP